MNTTLSSTHCDDDNPTTGGKTTGTLVNPTSEAASITDMYFPYPFTYDTTAGTCGGQSAHRSKAEGLGSAQVEFAQASCLRPRFQPRLLA